MSEQFIIGKIVNTHGVKGELKVLPLTDNVNRFEKLKSIYIEKKDTLTEHKISNVKFLNNFVILKIENIDSIDEAENYKESYIKIDRKNALKLPKNSYYISDLIGLDVISEGGEDLGRIKDVIQNAGNDIYVVEYNGKELLIPAVKKFIKSVDIKDKIMMVDLPEGLKDL